jgi:cell division protein FtsZ
MSAPTMSAPTMSAAAMSAPVMTATAPALEPRLDAAPVAQAAQPAPAPAKPAASDAQRPFLPPPAFEPQTMGRAAAQPAPRPFAEADMVNAGQESRRDKIRRGLSLFERVTGTGRARDAKAEAAAPQPVQPAMQREPAFRQAPQAQVPAQAPAAPQAQAATPMAAQPAPQMAAPMAPQMAPQMTMPAQQMMATPAPRTESAQPRLGIEPADKPRSASMDDDLLDIPAFLRRQAN